MINHNRKVLAQALPNRNRIIPCLRVVIPTPFLPINTTPTRGTLEPQKYNPRHLNPGIKPIISLHTKRLPIKRELHQRRSLLHQTKPIIEIQLPGGLAVRAQGYDDLEVLFSELGCCHGGLDALGHDYAAAVVQGYVGDVEIGDLDGGAFALDRGVGEPVVEDVFWEVDADAGGVFFCHGADEQGWAEEVLEFEAESVGVGGVEVEHWIDERCAVDGLLVESCVNIV